MKTMKALPSGQVIDLADPTTYEFKVEEIDLLLSKLKRFNGFGMSVANHSVMVADTLYHLTGNPHIALRGLLHDSAEAYIGDISTPMKEALGWQVHKIEDAILAEIHRQLNVINHYNLAVQPLIKLVDVMALHYELNDLIANGIYQPNDLWKPVQNVKIHSSMTSYIERSFLQSFNHYLGLCENDIEFSEVVYLSLEGKQKCFAHITTHRLGDLQ